MCCCSPSLSEVRGPFCRPAAGWNADCFLLLAPKSLSGSVRRHHSASARWRQRIGPVRGTLDRVRFVQSGMVSSARLDSVRRALMWILYAMWKHHHQVVVVVNSWMRTQHKYILNILHLFHISKVIQLHPCWNIPVLLVWMIWQISVLQDELWDWICFLSHYVDNVLQIYHR